MINKKWLFVARHAKAEQGRESVDDFHRKLLPEGIQRTEKVAKVLLTHKLVPEYIVCSPAVRTLETAKIFASFFRVPQEKIVAIDNLYRGSTNDYFDAIYSLPNEFQSVMMVGHNPYVSELVNFFNKNIEPLATSTVVILESQTSTWNEFVLKYIKVREIFIPKKL